jgi:hypothetical protein
MGQHVNWKKYADNVIINNNNTVIIDKIHVFPWPNLLFLICLYVFYFLPSQLVPDSQAP